MDPNVCFAAFCGAVEDGELDSAIDCQSTYKDWTSRGGFKATDKDEAMVLKLNADQGCYLVNYAGVERWRKARRNIEI